MIELAIAGTGAAILLGLVWWYDSRGPGEWEDLLSPAAREAHELLRMKFRAEEGALAWASGCEALARGADFLAGLVPDRLALLRRLALYSRIAAAVAPPPDRLRFRLLLLRRSFLALLRPGQAAGAELDQLRALDAETLSSLRTLLLSLQGGVP